MFACLYFQVERPLCCTLRRGSLYHVSTCSAHVQIPSRVCAAIAAFNVILDRTKRQSHTTQIMMRKTLEKLQCDISDYTVYCVTTLVVYRRLQPQALLHTLLHLTYIIRTLCTSLAAFLIFT